MPRIRTVAAALALFAVAGFNSPALADEPKPPEGLDSKAPLSPADLARKNEDGYFTGLPLANVDPSTGVGFGARAYYYNNGKRTDPRFPYTPYLHRVFLQLFATTGGLQFHWLDYDAPAFAGSPYRIRAQLIYQRNTAQHFFGLGNDAVGDLTFTGAGRDFKKFATYRDALEELRPDGTALTRYDEYDLERPLTIFGVERTFFRGLVRALVGAAINHVTIRDYSGETVSAIDADGRALDATMGTSRLAEQCATGELVGCDGGHESYLRFAVSYDTRDFEPDPNSGVYADLSLDVGPGVFSKYRFVRFLAAARGYYSPIPEIADLVIAARATVQWQSAGTRFYSQNTIPFTEDVRTGLGGIRTLRGFRADRFVGRVFGLGNLELRYTFLRFAVLRQKFALIAVPFLDVGRVYDDLGSVTFRGFRRGQGAALRISWNLATIVTVDYGFSSEDSGLYINFAHIF